MFSSNQLKLIFVSIVVFAASGFLFYKGLVHEFSKLSSLKNQTAENLQELKESSPSAAVIDPKFEKVKVLRVIDGDTIDTNIGRIRYIGVDTPETVDPRRGVQCFGKDASDENKRLVEGKQVYLEKDVSETDKFRRLLRYVYLELDDGQLLFVNDYLVRQGFAQTVTYPPDVKYIEQFTQAQRENQRGLWMECN